MGNIIPAKAISKITVLLVLIVCLMYLQRPPQAGALTCRQMCEAQNGLCIKGCNGSEACLEVCAFAVRACLAGCQ